MSNTFNKYISRFICWSIGIALGSMFALGVGLFFEPFKDYTLIIGMMPAAVLAGMAATWSP